MPPPPFVRSDRLDMRWPQVRPSLFRCAQMRQQIYVCVLSCVRSCAPTYSQRPYNPLTYRKFLMELSVRPSLFPPLSAEITGRRRRLTLRHSGRRRTRSSRGSSWMGRDQRVRTIEWMGSFLLVPSFLSILERANCYYSLVFISAAGRRRGGLSRADLRQIPLRGSPLSHCKADADPMVIAVQLHILTTAARGSLRSSTVRLLFS